MIITSCGNSDKLAKKIAALLKVPFSPLMIASFPDGDIYLKFNTNLKGKKLVIVQSFYPHPDMSLFDVLFAAKTARDLGAKKVILVAPYLAYMRQDTRFHPGECVSSKVMADLLNNAVNKVITIDPHLHRYRSLKEIFSIPAICLTANGLIVEYIKKNFSKKNDQVIIGPDWESYQWAKNIATAVGIKATVLEKRRLSSWHVKETMINPVPIRNKDVIIIDDIISTGRTIAEAARKARKMKARSVTAIGVHGILIDDAIEKMEKAGVRKIVTTNCVEHATSGIDVASLIARELRKE